MNEYFGLCPAVDESTSALAAAAVEPALAVIAVELRAALDSDLDTIRIGACVGPFLVHIASLAAALSAAYPWRPASDLGLSYGRMLEHRGFFGAFCLASPPQPPPETTLFDGRP